MKNRYYHLFYMITFLSFLANPLFATSIEILQPIDKNIFVEEYIPVVVKVNNKDIDKIIITTDQNEQSTIIIEENRDTYCYNGFSFSLGKHFVIVKAFINNQQKAESKVEFFRKSIRSKRYKKAPKDYTRSFLHNEKNEQKCKKCHDMSINEKKGFAFLNISESNCFTCHKSLIYKKFAHAPTVNFVCLPCHDQKDNNSRFLTPKIMGDTCLKCHKKIKKAWNKQSFKHDPVKKGTCNNCHSPHSSNIEHFIREDIWHLCISCHKEKQKKGHITTTFSKRSHPTRAKIDPSKPNHELTCISCHRPHVANNDLLLRKYSIKDGRVKWCQRCHKK